MSTTIEAHGLTKRYGRTLAVDDLSFRVEAGRVTGFVGPNGAGKSTTMRLLLGLDAPDAGERAGRRASATAIFARHCARSERCSTPARRIPAGALGATCSGSRGATACPCTRVDEVLELVGLSAAGRKRTGGFSLGMAQRLGIAAAMLGDPPVLVFDEPVNGLDPDGIRWIRSFLRSLADEGRTVFVSSHLMSELEGVADELIVIGRGRLIAQTTVDELLSARSDGRVHVRTPQVTEVMAALAGAGADVTSTGSEALVVSGLEPDRIAQVVAEQRSSARRALPRTSVARGRVLRAHPRGRRLRRRAAGAGGVSATAFATARPRAGLFEALRSEWVKLRSVRSTYWSLLLLVAISILFTAVSDLGIEHRRRKPGVPRRQRHRPREPHGHLVRADRRGRARCARDHVRVQHAE